MITRTITKRNGDTFTVLLDDADADYFDQYNWNVTDHNYVARRIGKRSTVYLHRLLNGEPEGLLIDHKNRNRLDNRRENLRVCNRAQNNSNNETKRDNSSGYVGVRRNRTGKWEAGFYDNNSYVYLGIFDDAAEAAKARDRAVLEHRGEFASLNFPDLALAN